MMAVTTGNIVSWIAALASTYGEQQSYLTELDAAIGDADHGSNMARGFAAARDDLQGDPPETPAAALKRVAMVLMKTVGGASGPLYGTFFLKAATTCPQANELNGDQLLEALAAGTEGVQQRGKAEVGDKTMVDALVPAVEALRESRTAGEEPAAMLAAAATAAEAGRDSTYPLVARKGRASYLGDRSRDHLDPGATSTALLLAAARDHLAA